MTAVAKWGTSLGVRIPSNIVKTMNFEVGDEVEVKENNGVVIISKSKPEINLEDLLETVQEGEALGESWPDDAPKGHQAW